MLDGALDAGMNLPHSCKGGSCGACRARLLAGVVTYPHGRPIGLSEAEAAEGFILLCQACADSDLAIDVAEVRTPEQARIKRLPSRIERLTSLSHDVLGLYLRLPAAEPLQFEAGQYLDIMLPDGRRRSFSIASPPHDSSLLELHVRRVHGGEFTERLFTEEARNRLLSIEAPLGHFVYRPTEGGRVLLVGGGTGLAPLKSILRHVIETGLPRDVVLYWGVRDERDLYAHDELRALVERAANFRYYPVLSEPGAHWAGRRGWVHEAVLRDLPDLRGMDVYASGPPAMIAAVRQDFVRHGADPARLSFDSFDYAPDSLERQRITAATKS
ncbi:MAG: CDP-6-deoxy-delta-3,4-glucoseen reductase [Steroidobacteraceae bacterium]